MNKQQVSFRGFPQKQKAPCSTDDGTLPSDGSRLFRIGESLLKEWWIASVINAARENNTDILVAVEGSSATPGRIKSICGQAECTRQRPTRTMTLQTGMHAWILQNYPFFSGGHPCCPHGDCCRWAYSPGTQSTPRGFSCLCSPLCPIRRRFASWNMPIVLDFVLDSALAYPVTPTGHSERRHHQHSSQKGRDRNRVIEDNE